MHQAEPPDRHELVGNLHEGLKSESGLWIAGAAGHHRLEVDELEVVELASLHRVVELLHHVPGTVANTDHDDGQRPVARINDGAFGISLGSHLTISNDDQDVILRRCEEWNTLRRLEEHVR